MIGQILFESAYRRICRVQCRDHAMEGGCFRGRHWGTGGAGGTGVLATELISKGGSRAGPLSLKLFLNWGGSAPSNNSALIVLLKPLRCP